MKRLDNLCSQKNGFYVEIRSKDFHAILYLKKEKSNPKKMTICIRPPFVIRNHMPSTINLNLFYDSYMKQSVEDYTIESSKNLEIYASESAIELQCSLNLPNYQRSAQILLLSRREKPPKTIQILDDKREPLLINVDYKLQGSHIFTFYPIVVLINSTLLPLTFYYRKSGNSRLVSGQKHRSNIVAHNEAKKIAISIGASDEKSKFFKIGTVGAQNIIEYVGEKSRAGLRMKYQFTYEVQLAKVVKDELLFIRTVVISPRLLLINDMKDDLVILQYNSQALEMILARQSREPYH